MDRFAPSPSPSTFPIPARASWRLWLYGLAMLAPAVGFARRYPLRGNAERLTDIGKLAGYGAAEFAGYVGGVAAMFLLYGLALRESRRLPARRALPAVFICGGALAATMAWLYPLTAIDLFIATVRSRLLTTHGADPLAARPADFPDDPLMAFASREWSDNVSPYGPLWNLIAAPVTALAGDDLPLALAGFKLLAVGALLLGGWVITRAVAAEGGDGIGGATGPLLYLWNPLVLWEGAANGHNDVVMTVPLLLALLAWQRGRLRLVVPWLVVAALIKYVAVPLIPLAAVALWRRVGATAGWPARGRLAAESAALSGLVAAVAFAPFYDLGAVRASVAAQGGIVLTSPAAVAIGLLNDAIPGVDARRWVMGAGVAILAGGLASLALALWQRPERLPRAAFEALFLFLLVATWNFRAWYLIWPVALAALLPWGWPARRAVAWSAGGLAGYALFIWIWHWWPADFGTIEAIAVPLMTGPALLLTLAEATTGFADRRARRPLPDASAARSSAAAER